MKNIIKITLVAFSLTVFGCDEPETVIPPIKQVVYAETFNLSANDFQEEDSYLDYNGWTSIAQTGTVEWTEQDDDNNGYLQFRTFATASGEPVNIAWAITPAINLDKSSNEVLTFKSSREFVNVSANKMEAYISTDFDGTNFATATWTKLPAVMSMNTNNSIADGVMTTDSGQIDLSMYSGDIHIGFKAYGSSKTQSPTSNNQNGSLRFDEVKIYDKTLK